MSTAQTACFDSVLQWCILTYLLLFSHIDFLPLPLKACLRVLIDLPRIFSYTNKISIVVLPDKYCVIVITADDTLLYFQDNYVSYSLYYL